MALQKFIKQGHASWNIVHGRMNLAQVLFLLLDRGFEVDARHITKDSRNDLVGTDRSHPCVGTEHALNLKFRQLNASRRVFLFLPSPRIIAIHHGEHGGHRNQTDVY